MALSEFGLAKFDIRQSPRPKVRIKEDQRRLPKYISFHSPVLQGPFTRWVNNKIK